MLSRIRSALASLTATVCLAAAAAPALAAVVVLPQTIAPGFGLTRWYVVNTGPGTPFTGSCGSSPSFGFVDADGPTGAGDAYDNAWEIFVNGTAFAAPGSSVDLTGTTLTAGPVTMSGLQVTVQHYYSPTSALARILVSIRNPGVDASAAMVQVPINLGSDGSTIIRATSSGDTIVTTADRWIISTDTGPYDPVNTTVFYGPGSPAIVPAAYTQTVFNCAATNGLGATFNLTIPAGGTRSLMFFAGLGGLTVNNNSISSAQTAAALFNSTATLPVDWLSGLSSTQKSQIANWSFFSTCAAEGLDGAQLSVCSLICESASPPESLDGLILFYSTAFGSPPPCAR